MQSKPANTSNETGTSSQPRLNYTISMPSRSNKSRQSSNASSSARKGWISRRSSQSAGDAPQALSIPLNGEGSSTRPRTSPRIESSTSLRPNYYYSGLDLLNGSRRGSDETTRSVEGSHSGSSLTLMDEDLPAPDFVGAGEKRNADFHELFPMLAREEFLLEDYGCALQHEITIQGRIYVTERNICFYSNIFGWITNFAISISTITSLEKKSTAYFIPNAIQITTRHEKFTLSSFLARDATYDLLYRLWCLRTHPEDNARWSVENTPEIKHRSLASAMAQTIQLPISSTVASDVREPPGLTECACGKEGRHYSEPVIDMVLAGTPEKILKLMLDKGFMMDFMSNSQKLLDIKMTEWAPIVPDSPLLTRELSYIKPLHLWVGPKQTKCEQHEVMTHVDFHEYVSIVTTTRTPDVPSGHSFSVKTRTCLMWASATSSRVVVSTQVEWTGRSLVKGLIESSAIDGVKVYLIDLVNAVREHINQHKADFLPKGMVDTVISTAGAAEPPYTPNPDSFEPNAGGTEASYPVSEKRKQGAAERVAHWRRSDLQLALDTLREASQLAWNGIVAAVDRIHETYPNGISASSVLWAVIMLLGLSNLWFLVGMGASLKRIDDKLGDILNQLEPG
ncbi:hypothetical protein D9619_002469 [Psilocybe cf. subviscida]|uniref:VASt domain-containing protein n=1 Tax=Psilocybe cf. subviscida TaxID=2480587 RepID=A0A8H5AYC5_9AGAR|nr:hypothetical protein D9619_002469 [Psilocybe cf. subviscida]